MGLAKQEEDRNVGCLLLAPMRREMNTAFLRCERQQRKRVQKEGILVTAALV